ncbi:LuxR family transcriptional regulator [Kitasatospora sp. DSM 101779]|uniref:LuxR family transcriptional regulator n=1 Tax=Kitasatospora sp. DSM 101779 TaxID=2853165 RepID=UPI0021DB78E0|nr:LuxR family transcriptional regulator [Kitasatospora sp. DSM 101779]MCU7823789.1 LuxR family transcriptional regulator [Kitasatospora sp. DSM 101779]
MADGGTGALPNEEERALYRAVLAQGGRVMFRDALAENPEAVLRLVELGFLVHHAEDASLTAVNPRTVSDRLSAELRSAGTRMLIRAEQTPGALEDLAQAYDATPPRVDRTGEVQHVHGFGQIRHRILQLEADAREEGLALQPGGARPAGHLAAGRDRARAFLARGAALRTVYHPGARLDEATADYAAELTELGARFRILAEPFTRMLIFDRRIAVLPAAADNSSAAFVEDPAVVGYLVGVFERDWERAERVQWRTAPQDGNGLPVHEQVGRLLAQGLTQRTVASRLGLGERTVAAHIARLRELYGAETLFQLGWQMRADAAEDRPE